MEVAMEVEDDVFFADLSKQISLLIMDDDDDEGHHHLVAQCPPVTLQAYSQAAHANQARQPPVLYEQICRRESKGTGVFIPLSSQPRRKNRQRKFTSSNTKFNRHFDNSRGLPHNNDSINPKRC